MQKTRDETKDSPIKIPVKQRNSAKSAQWTVQCYGQWLAHQASSLAPSQALWVSPLRHTQLFTLQQRPPSEIGSSAKPKACLSCLGLNSVGFSTWMTVHLTLGLEPSLKTPVGKGTS